MPLTVSLTQQANIYLTFTEVSAEPLCAVASKERLSVGLAEGAAVETREFRTRVWLGDHSGGALGAV